MSQTNKQSRRLVSMEKAHGAAVGPEKTQRSAVGFPNLRRSSFSSAYTLIEVMVVAVVVVLMLGMALPVFRVITGSRSEAGASNIIAGMLGRARTDAIGLQQSYGVAFIYNSSTQQSYLAEVYFPTPIGGYNSPAGANVPPGGYFTAPAIGGYYNNYFINQTNTTQNYSASSPGGVGVAGPAIEIVPNTDVVPLPTGIGVQTICNCRYNGSTRNSNGYLSVGVILFDSYGRLISMPYGISAHGRLWQVAGLAAAYPSLSIGLPTNGAVGSMNSSGQLTALGVFSQFGVVVYQNDAYSNQKSPNQPEALYMDPTTSGNQALPDYTTGTPTQQQADNWLDQNATPLLIDRYTGTLIKAE